MALNVGDTAGDYQIIGILGAGGMGKVYKARNVITDRVEALKVLLPDLTNETEVADRFMREIKVLASLSHPNIAALHTAVRVDNQLLMLMEFIEGRTVEDRLKDGPIPPGEAAGYISQALSALAFAHEHGVVHRDIKPANMMITPDGQLKVMDFGIAKAAADRRLTMTGTTPGSLCYMSPEQVKGSADLDARSDLYSVGVSLYEMVTGTRPFKGDSDYSIMVAHLEQLPVPPIQIDPSLPVALNEIILTAIQKDRENRFQSAQAFRTALDSVATSLGQPARPSATATRPQPSAPQAPPLAPLAPTVTQAVPQVQPQQPPTLPRVASPTVPEAVPPPPMPLPQSVPPPPAFQAAPPPPPPQPVAWAEPPATTAAPVQRSGRRGLWMALGGLIVLALLAVAAIQGPHLYRTWAGAPSKQSVVPVETPMPPAPASTPDAAPAAQPSDANVAPPSTVAPAAPAAPAAAHASQAATHATPQSGAPPSVEPQRPTAPPPPAAPAVDTARLEQLHDRLGVIAPRANAIRASLQSLERQQQASGYGMRGDISASWKRMEYLLDEAQAALNANNPDRAQKNLDLAEQEADKLDKFLGR
jgi:eukaryotic-like serine/threonine-protein kinase